MSFSCVHISDIHFRGLSRHEEYRESFTAFFNRVKKLAPDCIYVGGDIVHSKTQGITPELIDILSWWFTELAAIAPTHVILGNHDGLVLNKHRQDAISPIISALDNDRIFLYKKSGTYPTGIPGYNWCVFSCFDEEGYSNAKPVPGEVNIALYHGAVRGSLTDIEWSIDGEIESSFFDDYEFTFLGDIHKVQPLDAEGRIWYAGSAIQQNYGEAPGKGFLYWEIDSADEWQTSFYEIPHGKPFITIDWAGSVSDTLKEAEQYPVGSRFRIKSDYHISQVEIKHLHSSLKEIKQASEIVHKVDHVADTATISTDHGVLAKEDLRDSKAHQRLMRQYYKDANLTDQQWEDLDDMINQYVNQVAHDDTARNIKWSIKSIKFDNTFAYGKGNVIDFEKLSGITGLFGRNRSGKSSIPGTIMYGLFNTTDRGPIKNLHVINTRKGHCKVEVNIAVNGLDYRIERQSTKHQTRAGLLHAATHVNVFKLDENGEPIKDMSGEQRRDTDKIVRKLVGTQEDFLLTSLASQGEMNAFIKHRATQRKSILTKFLDLDVFEKMLSAAREDSLEVKALLKSAPDRDWDTLISDKKHEKEIRHQERSEIEDELSELRADQQELGILLATHKDRDMVTVEDIAAQEDLESNLQKNSSQLSEKIISLGGEIGEIDSKINKIESLKEQFPIEELRARRSAQQDLSKSLLSLKHRYETESTLLQNQERSIKKLTGVPCGDKFPTCKFIKDSHKNKSLISNQKDLVTELHAQVESATASLEIILSENLDEKLSKYDATLQQLTDLKVKRSGCLINLHELESRQATAESSLQEVRHRLQQMRVTVVDTDLSAEVSKIKQRAFALNKKIIELDAERLALSEILAVLSNDIDQLYSDREKYSGLVRRWKVYDLFMQAVNKKGIPLQIISLQLPAINSEIAKILQDTVGFTVELEADANSNSMDIFINYGDSRRIIECASGMEKMVSSLAIRVALINISSLPKTDMLIIDEGFGALDASNVEACNRLLASLKRWFKNILVISHVDAVKDEVDNVLEIMRIGKDSKIAHE